MATEHNFTDGSIAGYEWSPDGQRIVVLTHCLQMRDGVIVSSAPR